MNDSRENALSRRVQQRRIVDKFHEKGRKEKETYQGFHLAGGQTQVRRLIPRPSLQAAKTHNDDSSMLRSVNLMLLSKCLNSSSILAKDVSRFPTHAFV
jgi:hypothetical protein